MLPETCLESSSLFLFCKRPLHLRAISLDPYVSVFVDAMSLGSEAMSASQC